MRSFVGEMWEDWAGRFLVLLMAAVVFVCLFGMSYCTVYPFALHASEEQREFTVKSKERANDGPWLVFTDHGVFSVEDSIWYFKFDASDRYNEITPGESYSCKVAGFRIHFTSEYENLLDCEQIS